MDRLMTAVLCGLLAAVFFGVLGALWGGAVRVLAKLRDRVPDATLRESLRKGWKRRGRLPQRPRWPGRGSRRPRPAVCRSMSAAAGGNRRFVGDVDANHRPWDRCSQYDRRLVTLVVSPKAESTSRGS